ncbi:MAG TPA: peroxidase [Dehalococcoidia bacterium]|nr:peroxidase [Dehalococcoidia bacterium]
MDSEMEPMYLPEVEGYDPPGERGEEIRQMRAAGIPIPQLLHLLAFKPDRTAPLTAFTQAALRGPSPLSPGQRELIAAFTSRHNQCLF